MMTLNSKTLARRISTLGAAVLLCLCWVAPVQATQVSAFVDRTQIGLNETLGFSFKADDDSGVRPDFSALELYFDILGQRQSSQVRIGNGQTQTLVQWDLTLQPKVEGQIRIPPIEYDGSRSDAITITVLPARTSTATPGGNQSGSTTTVPPSASAGSADYFAELDIDKAEAYVGEQVLLTLRISSAVPLSGMQASPWDVRPSELSKVDEQRYEQIIKGRRYSVYQVTYALFPQQAGLLDVPAISLNARLGGGFSLYDRMRAETVRMTTKAQSIQVKDKPASVGTNQWLPARNLSLDQQIQYSGSNQFRVGEPITRRIEIKAEGVRSSQLPNLEMPVPDSFKLYPEAPKVEQQQGERGMTAYWSQSFGLVPSQEGRFELPAISLQWWDTKSDQLREATVPAQVIEVLPAVAGVQKEQSAPTGPAPLPLSGDRASAADGNGDVQASDLQGAQSDADNAMLWWLLWGSNLFWLLLSSALAVLCWRRRGQSGVAAVAHEASARVTLKQAQAAVKAAVDGQDKSALRLALLAWGATLLSEPGYQPPSSLRALRHYVDDSLAAQLDLLDAALYGAATSTDFAFAAFWLAFQNAQIKTPGSAETEALPPLYPTL